MTFPSLLYAPLAMSSNLWKKILELEKDEKKSHVMIRYINSADLGRQYATYHIKRNPPNYLAAEYEEIPAKLLLCTQQSCSKYFH